MHQFAIAQSRGLVGYSLRAEFGAKRSWTLSAWEDELALQAFAHAQPHGRTITAMARKMGATQFVRWKVAGSQVSVSWEDALNHWRRS